jgi:FkbM family methyltransferase
MRKEIADTAVDLAARFGYSIIPTWRLDRWPLQRHLRAVFERYAIDTVLDVGANTGQYRDFLRTEVGFQGVIHSFEPLSSLAPALRARSQTDPRWHVHAFALGDKEQVLELNVAASDVFSSFLAPSPELDSAFHQHTGLVRREPVRVRRLDDLLPELDIADVARVYLKVDTQGFDMDVLRGARALLRSIKALQFELPIRGVYDGAPHYLANLRQLNEWGFEISSLFPIVVDRNAQAVELDCVMVARTEVEL